MQESKVLSEEMLVTHNQISNKIDENKSQNVFLCQNYLQEHEN